MLEKNSIVSAVVEAIGAGGEGIIRHEGITFFVPACLPGEKVVFKVLKIKGSVGDGKIEEVMGKYMYYSLPRIIVKAYFCGAAGVACNIWNIMRSLRIRQTR